MLTFTLNQIHTILDDHGTCEDEHRPIVTKALNDLEKIAEKQNDPQNNFLTPRELSKKWRVSEHTLRQWRKERIGPQFTDIGGYKYKISDIKDYEKKHTIKTT